MTRIIIGVVLLMSLTITARAQNENAQNADQQFSELIELIESRQFAFIGIMAYPQRGAQVDLTTRPNFLRMNGEEGSADLPYFGRATGGAGSYGTSSGGIQFNGPITGYSQKTNSKKQKIIVKFSAKEGSESYSCILTVFKSGSANLSITSNYKQSIRYSGKVSSLD